MLSMLIIQKYQDYRMNLIEYFDSLGYNVFSDSDCKNACSMIAQSEFDIIICDLDYEFNSDFENFYIFFNTEKVKKSNLILMSSRFKSKSEIASLNINNQSFFLINGNRMSEIASLIGRELLSKSD
jgi:PleD family two-component response regulator